MKEPADLHVRDLSVVRSAVRPDDMGMEQHLIDAATAAADFGVAAARKAGRDDRWPFVPVVNHAGTAQSPKPWTQQIKGLAFATRAEAVAAAEAHIAHEREVLGWRLAEPRNRALREQHGLPREIG